LCVRGDCIANLLCHCATGLTAAAAEGRLASHSPLQVDVTQILHVVAITAEHIKAVRERRVEQLLEPNVLSKIKAATTTFMMHLVTAKVLFEVALHVAKLFEQIVKVLEEIVKIGLARPVAAVAAKIGMSHLVILSAFCRVAQHLVRFGDLTELSLCTRLGALVWMVLERKLAECLLNLLVGGGRLDAERLIVVPRLVACGGQV